MPTNTVPDEPKGGLLCNNYNKISYKALLCIRAPSALPALGEIIQYSGLNVTRSIWISAVNLLPGGRFNCFLVLGQF